MCKREKDTQSKAEAYSSGQSQLKRKKNVRHMKSHECFQSAVAPLPSPRHSIKNKIKIVLMPVLWKRERDREKAPSGERAKVALQSTNP